MTHSQNDQKNLTTKISLLEFDNEKDQHPDHLESDTSIEDNSFDYLVKKGSIEIEVSDTSIQLELEPKKEKFKLKDEDYKSKKNLSNIFDVLKKYASSPEEEIDAINEIFSYSALVANRLKEAWRIAQLPEKGQFNKYQERHNANMNALEHLKEVWGQYLKKYNNKLEDDILYQDDLRKLDKPLLSALNTQLRSIQEDINDYIPSSVIRNDRKLIGTTFLDMAGVSRHNAALKRRYDKQSVALEPAISHK